MAIILALVFAHICGIGGCYLFAWQMNVLVKGSVSPGQIFTFPSLFWGLFIILGGFCFIFSILLWDKIFR